MLYKFLFVIFVCCFTAFSGDITFYSHAKTGCKSKLTKSRDSIYYVENGKIIYDTLKISIGTNTFVQLNDGEYTWSFACGNLDKGYSNIEGSIYSISLTERSKLWLRKTYTLMRIGQDDSCFENLSKYMRKKRREIEMLNNTPLLLEKF